MIEPGTVRCQSPDETEELGRRIGASLDGPATLLLVGELGAGKTLITRGIVAGLGGDAEEVSSPTFTIINRYEGGRLPVNHLDLYRLETSRSISALYEIGLEEILAERAVTVVEWAERLEGFPIGDAIRVELAVDGEDSRQVTIRR